MSLFEYEKDDGGRKEYFPNPAGDCVCRAIAIVTKMDYMEVFDLLKDTMKCNPNRGIHVEKKEFRQLMTRLGFTYGLTPTRASHLRKGEMPAKGRLICLTKRHAIAVIDGVVRDTYDSRYHYRGREKKETTIHAFFKYDKEF